MLNLESKIVWIKNSDINRQKWDTCIEKCDWGNIYALSWFLDLMTDNQWEAMVIGDYEYIMPVPYRKKFGIKYTYRPNFCQQLGVFSCTFNLPQAILNQFIEELISSYKHINYPLNHFNILNDNKDFKLVKRTNFLIDLNHPYQKIYSNFSVGLKKSLKSTSNANLEINYNVNTDDAIELHKNAWGKVVTIPNADFLNFKKVNDYATKIGLSESISVLREGQLLGACIILKFKNKIYYPFSAIAPEGRKYAAVAVLINEILKTNSERDLIFDFEGSDIETVKTFYKRFNPRLETYFQIEKTAFALTLISSALKSIKSKKS